MDKQEDQVRRRAHELWENEGRPEGHEMDFWLQAEREIGEAGKEAAQRPGDAAPAPNRL
jgi:hypothetical protein